MQYAARHLFTIREKNEFESFSHIQVKIQVYQLYFTRFNIFFSFYPFDQSWKKILRFLDRKSSSSKIGSQYQESIIGIHRMIRGLLIKSCLQLCILSSVLGLGAVHKCCQQFFEMFDPASPVTLFNHIGYVQAYLVVCVTPWQTNVHIFWKFRTRPPNCIWKNTQLLGEITSSSISTLYKNPSDHTVGGGGDTGLFPISIHFLTTNDKA